MLECNVTGRRTDPVTQTWTFTAPQWVVLTTRQADPWDTEVVCFSLLFLWVDVVDQTALQSDPSFFHSNAESGKKATGADPEFRSRPKIEKIHPGALDVKFYHTGTSFLEKMAKTALGAFTCVHGTDKP